MRDVVIGENSMKKTSILQNKILIVGCDSLGATIANKFSIEGKNVMVVDEDSKNFDLLSEQFSGYTFSGDTTDLKVLEEACIASAKEVIVTTGNDNKSIFVAHVAKKIYNVPNVYVRLLDPKIEILLKGTGIKALYPLELTFDKFKDLREEQK